MSDSKENKKQKKESVKSSFRSLMVSSIIIVMILALTFLGFGSPDGMKSVYKDIFQQKIKNPDGSLTIPGDAQTGQNSNNPNAYVGKVLNQKIQLGKRDEFNINLSRLKEAKIDPYTKYQYARYYFDLAINKIIGMQKARDLDLIISKDFLIKEVGKRYYPDTDGEPDFGAIF
jgi:hypothetical protein